MQNPLKSSPSGDADSGLSYEGGQQFLNYERYRASSVNVAVRALSHARLCRSVLTRAPEVSLNACTRRVFPIRVRRAGLHSRAASPPREPGPDVGRHGDSISRAAFSIARRSTRVNSRSYVIRDGRVTVEYHVRKKERKGEGE